MATAYLAPYRVREEVDSLLVAVEADLAAERNAEAVQEVNAARRRVREVLRHILDRGVTR